MERKHLDKRTRGCAMLKKIFIKVPYFGNEISAEFNLTNNNNNNTLTPDQITEIKKMKYYIDSLFSLRGNIIKQNEDSLKLNMVKNEKKRQICSRNLSNQPKKLFHPSDDTINLSNIKRNNNNIIENIETKSERNEPKAIEKSLSVENEEKSQKFDSFNFFIMDESDNDNSIFQQDEEFLNFYC